MKFSPDLAKCLCHGEWQCMYSELIEFCGCIPGVSKAARAIWIQERHRKKREIIWVNMRTAGMGKQWLSDEKYVRFGDSNWDEKTGRKL